MAKIELLALYLYAMQPTSFDPAGMVFMIHCLHRDMQTFSLEELRYISTYMRHMISLAESSSTF